MVCFAVAAFFAVLVWCSYRWGLDGLLERPMALSLALIGVLVTLVAVAWLLVARRLSDDLIDLAGGDIIDQDALRDGLNVGAGSFEWDHDSVTASLAMVQCNYSWRAFRALKETPSAFFLVIDEASGLILPKRGFADDLGRQEFRAFAAERIGAAG